MRFLKFILTSFVIFQFGPFAIFANTGFQKDTISVLFNSEETLDLTIKLNIDSLFKGGLSEQQQYPGIITFKDNMGGLSTIPVHFTKRGHFRKSFNVCDFYEPVVACRLSVNTEDAPNRIFRKQAPMFTIGVYEYIDKHMIYASIISTYREVRCLKTIDVLNPALDIRRQFFYPPSCRKPQV